MIYYELTIIKDHLWSEPFKFKPNKDIIKYMLKWTQTDGTLAVAHVSEKHVDDLRRLCKTDEEKEIFNKLDTYDGLDILIHYVL